MKVVIIGAGEVGFHVAKALSEENYDITIIDIDIKEFVPFVTFWTSPTDGDQGCWLRFDIL